MEPTQLLIVLPALASVATVATVIVKAAIGLIRSMTAKFEAQATEKFKSFETQTLQTTSAIKEDIRMFRNSVEHKFTQLETENRDSRSEMREYVATEFRKMDDRISRFETSQIAQVEKIHEVEKALLEFKLEINRACIQNCKPTRSTDHP